MRGDGSGNGARECLSRHRAEKEKLEEPGKNKSKARRIAGQIRKAAERCPAKGTTTIVKNHGVIVIEDLKVTDD